MAAIISDNIYLGKMAAIISDNIYLGKMAAIFSDNVQQSKTICCYTCYVRHKCCPQGLDFQGALATWNSSNKYLNSDFALSVS